MWFEGCFILEDCLGKRPQTEDRVDNWNEECVRSSVVVAVLHLSRVFRVVAFWVVVV